MGDQTRPKPSAIRKPEAVNDQHTAEEIEQAEASATDFKDFLDRVLSQIRRIVGKPRWYDTPVPMSLPLDAKGDLLGHDGTGLVRVPVGDPGKVLGAAPEEPSGLGWVDGGGGGESPYTEPPYERWINVATGSDENDGSEGAPWATIQKGVDWAKQFARGLAKVHIAAGNYPEDVELDDFAVVNRGGANGLMLLCDMASTGKMGTVVSSSISPVATYWGMRDRAYCTMPSGPPGLDEVFVARQAVGDPTGLVSAVLSANTSAEWLELAVEASAVAGPSNEWETFKSAVTINSLTLRNVQGPVVIAGLSGLTLSLDHCRGVYGFCSSWYSIPMAYSEDCHFGELPPGSLLVPIREWALATMNVLLGFPGFAFNCGVLPLSGAGVDLSGMRYCRGVHLWGSNLATGSWSGLDVQGLQLYACLLTGLMGGTSSDVEVIDSVSSAAILVEDRMQVVSGSTAFWNPSDPDAYVDFRPFIVFDRGVLLSVGDVCRTTAPNLVVVAGGWLRGFFSSWSSDCTGSMVKVWNGDFGFDSSWGAMDSGPVTGAAGEPDVALHGACRVLLYYFAKYGGNTNPGPMIATRRLVSDPAPSGEVNISSLDTEDSDVGDAAVLLDGDYRLNLVDVPYGNPSGDVVSIRNGAGAWHPATGTSPPPGSTCTIGGLGKIDYPAASANDLAAGPLSELCAIHR